MRFFRVAVYITLLSLALLEICLRIYAVYPSDSPLFVNDPAIGYRARPNVTLGIDKTNSFGFNDIEHKKEKTNGSTRIAFIGDSFVFGAVSRAKNFTTVVQELADQSGADIEVLNMGIPGAGLDNYLALLQRDAVLMNVDVACIVFFVGNDITDPHPDFKVQVWLGSPRVVLRRPYLIGFSGEYFYVYRIFRAARRLIWERIANPSETFSRETFLSIEHQRSVVFKIPQSSQLKASYRRAVKIVKQMATQAEKNQMKFLLLLAPDELQVNEPLRLDVARRYNMDLAKYDFKQPQRVLTEQFAALEIQVIDLLPHFTKNSLEAPLYAKQDTHWNEEGNRVAAEKIWAAIRVLFLPQA